MTSNPNMEGAMEALFQPFAEKMKREGLAPIVIKTFRHYFAMLAQGQTGRISRTDLDPLTEEDIASLQDLTPFAAAGRQALEKAVVIKLNGGLGTSMGLSKAKSLLEAKEGLTFLDIMARQVLSYRKRCAVPLPIVFMNSFRTQADTLKTLEAYPELAREGIPLSFVQHRFPKVLREGLCPARWPEKPSLEWNPPGHGDIYTALITSGMLESLRAAGVVYAFVSNADNLGAVMDERILGYLADRDIPFLMEVTDRTRSDSKGGHLGRLKNGRLTLREIAQCPEEELTEFQDVSVYRFFNTNSIWLNLDALAVLLEKKDGVIPLPMIRNPKTLDPRNDKSPPVYQLETAMGSAISVFDGAQAVRVPRDRFIPVKKCRDLLVVWSDAFVLNERFDLAPNPTGRKTTPVVDLDERYYKRIDHLKARFPHGAPSLRECEALTVKGDVVFGKGIQIKGTVIISNQTDRQVALQDGIAIGQDLTFP